MPNFSEADADFDISKLPPEMQAVYRASQKAAQQGALIKPESQAIIAGDGIRAGYKVEIHFGPDRTSKREYKALLLLMESGKHFHGGGDGHMYFCMDHRVMQGDNTRPPSALPFLRATARKDPFRISGCGTPIPEGQIVLGRALCQGCQKMIDARWMTGQIPFYGSTGELSEAVEILFRRLKSNADLYAKYDETDIRYEACARDQIARHGYIKGLEKARELRGLSIYLLPRLLKDMAGGSSLRSRIQAFLSA